MRTFKAVARMFDGEKQWNVIIGHYKTFKEAERDAYRFYRQYETGLPSVLWLQVLEGGANNG